MIKKYLMPGSIPGINISNNFNIFYQGDDDIE